MKTPSLKLMVGFFMLAAVVFTSCKKDNPTPQDPIVGSWIGKYGVGNADMTLLYSFNIKGDGTWQVRKADKTPIGSGTWKLEGGTFYGVYTYDLGDTYNVAAKYDEVAHTMTGSWGEGETGTGDGEFYLNKE
ncbi:MAG: hypothetical protein EOO13_14485 [Chitinophagaceae bacterium]|nr:MAG: hypothetical protein EOO13_14485 [Chitinophagaceae bacterium]